MENMLSKDTLQEIGRLFEKLWKVLLGPEGSWWLAVFWRVLRKEKDPYAVSVKVDPHSRLVRGWEKFYKITFGVDFDFSDVIVPKRPGSAKDWWLIILAQGMAPQRLLDKCREKFFCWCWTDKNLDEIVKSERTAKDGHYAVWVRARVEADEEFKNISANDLKKKNHVGITLEERLVLELWYFWKTNKHLDIQNVTLCAGSRYSDGRVPFVNWSDDKLLVYWCDTGAAHDHLRSRVAVSSAEGG